MEIDGPLTTTSEVISRLSEHSGYDLIFSDIRLRGQEVFSAFQTVMPECMVIFTTAYDEYALKAFKSNGVDYLLKPIDNESLSAAIKKAESIAGKNVSSKSNIDAANGELRSYRERILIWKGEELIPVNVNDILYFYFDQRHVYAKSTDGDIPFRPIHDARVRERTRSEDIFPAQQAIHCEHLFNSKNKHVLKLPSPDSP